MSNNDKQGLQKRNTLAEDEIKAITELQLLCDQHDHLHLSISLDDLKNRSGQEVDDFLYYADGQLVGYLYIDSWGRKEREITGMVRPEFRRQGIFRQLFEAAVAEKQTRNVEYLIIVSEHHSHSGHAFARAMKTRHDFSEHAMILGTFVAHSQPDPELHILPATQNDKQYVIDILASDIQGDQDDARQLVDAFLASPTQKVLLATLDGAPFGMLRLTYESDAVGIYSFIIRPEYRGKGYGRKLLEYTLQQIKAETPRKITLEVDTENKVALRLYESCGFEVRATYDYFRHTITQ